MLCHQTQSFVEILLGINGDEIRRCNLADGGRLRVLAFSNDTDRYVAVGDHAGQASVLCYRHNPFVLLLHDSRRIDDRLARLDRPWVRSHDVPDAPARASRELRRAVWVDNRARYGRRIAANGARMDARELLVARTCGIPRCGCGYCGR